MKKNKCKIITVGVPKGGTGKSTFVELLSVELAHSNYKVLIIDCDLQTENSYLFIQSRNKFNEERRADNKSTVPEVFCWKKPVDTIDIRPDIKKYAETYDYIIIDNHPDASQTFRFICQVADVILFPIEYTDKCIAIIPKMAAMMTDVNNSIREMFPEYEGVPVLTIINRVMVIRRQRINDVKTIIRAFDEDFMLARTIFPAKTEYQNTAAGLTVSDTGKDGRAQVQLLLREIDVIAGKPEDDHG